VKRFLLLFTCLGLLFFLLSCDSNPVEGPLVDSEGVSFNKTLPEGGQQGDITPKLSSEGGYLLGLQKGILTLTTFPENNLVDTFPLMQNQLIKEFKWSPEGDVFAYHTESDLPGESGAIYLSAPGGESNKIASLESAELGARQLLWSPCGNYLSWTKPFSIYNLETRETLVKEDLDHKYSFVRSPLFSDDGSMLAFTLLQEDGSEDLWVVDTSTGNARQVTARNDGDYPLYWLDDNNLLVGLGAISTGGGSVYGTATIDLKTGKVEPLCLTTGKEDRSPQRFYIAKGVSPEQGYFVGETHNSAGADSKIFLQDLADGKQEIICEGHHLLQTLWINEDELLLTAGQESIDGSRSGYQIMKYSKDSGCITLLNSEGEVHLLGIKDKQLYFLEANQARTHWILHSIELY